mgnify:CR=1 FL=1
MVGNESTEIMKEQLKKGYLKLAILYVLLNGYAHGYEISKRVRECTFGLISPKAGSLYPALKDLENSGFIEGEWYGERRKIKVYRITERGKEAFKEIIEKHFSLASAIRGWLLEQLAPIHFAENSDIIPGLMQCAAKIILLGDKAAIEDRIKFLKDFKEGLKKIDKVMDKLIANVEKRIKDLEEKAKIC